MGPVVTVCILFSALLAATVGQSGQSAVLYPQENYGGDPYLLGATYVEDTDKLSLIGRRIHSACSTGIWMFYQSVNYNANNEIGVQWAYGDNHCYDLSYSGGSVRSIRYVGPSENFRADSLTLYQYTYFKGTEVYTVDQVDRLGSHQSILITGYSDWAVFDGFNYQGNSVCLRVPGNGNPAVITDLIYMDPSIPYGSIRSARRGCQKSAINVTMNSMASTGFV